MQTVPPMMKQVYTDLVTFCKIICFLFRQAAGYGFDEAARDGVEESEDADGEDEADASVIDWVGIDMTLVRYCSFDS
jgi:hypothetical protein